MADAGAISLAAFTALGTIVGYLGTEVGCSSIFERMLWPSRYYNDWNVRSYGAYIFLMSIGGPIQKATVEALGHLAQAGLWKGYCRGNMLGTAFFKNTGITYTVWKAAGSGGRGDWVGPEQARNAFWAEVLALVPWEAPTEPVNAPDNEATSSQVRPGKRTQRPVHLLRLDRIDATTETATGNAPTVIVNNDLGPTKIRHIVAVVCSELVTLAFGALTVGMWKSPFAAWYLSPLFLKMLALLFGVRREQITAHPAPQEHYADEANNRRVYADDFMLCQISDFSKGFLLIEGQSELLLQYFRHYGHPTRDRKSDRVFEILSMLAVTATIFVYPSGLIAFIFAPMRVQWVWLGYQLYSMLAMHIYRFGNGEFMGTTQQWMARELWKAQHGRHIQNGQDRHDGQAQRSEISDQGWVVFDDGRGENLVRARLETRICDSVADGRVEVDNLARAVQRHDMETAARNLMLTTQA